MDASEKTAGEEPVDTGLQQLIRSLLSLCFSLSGAGEENSRLIAKKAMEDDPEVLVKGWLLREVSGGWLRQRRFWFTLTTDSLDCYSGPERDARRLSMLVLTSLCSVLWPDKHTYKQTVKTGANADWFPEQHQGSRKPEKNQFANVWSENGLLRHMPGIVLRFSHGNPLHGAPGAQPLC
ncbi:hypothetical protein NFI96_000185 [Prochilodus magdalenae]|nr:hypothetical protein NFI96_000185 [Prochilodus magdalenae]